MKNTALLTIFLLALASCAHQKPGGTPSLNTAPKMVNSNPTEAEKSFKKSGRTKAIFHVIDPLGVELVLLNIEEKKEEIVLVDKTLSQLALDPGYWQVSGFILNGKRYKTMNSGKQFIFKLKKNRTTYVGSYIFQCPKVNQTHLSEMKKMTFFNRYPYSSDQRLCELVVGSDFSNVNKVWQEIDKTLHKPLALGF